MFNKQFQALDKEHTDPLKFERSLEENAVENRFLITANELLNKSLIDINSFAYRVTEIEFYIFSENFKDIYTHKHPDQLEFGLWHFHRYGKKPSNLPKEPIRAGIDLTLGNGTDYAGVLIRSALSITDNRKIIGPSNFVAEILKRHELKNVKQFYINSNLSLKIADTKDLDKMEIHQKIRKGLKIKRHYPIAECRKFIDKKYCFYLKETQCIK